jgi:hypothetical protein
VRRTLAEGAKLAAVIILVGILVFSSLSSFFSIISMARADSTHTASSGEDLDRAVNYLYVNYDNTVGLIRESPDPEFENNYWVYSDNCLASLVLSNYDQSNLTLTGRAEDITNKMPYYLSQAGICNPMNLYMALTASVFYFDNAQPVILAKVGDATVKTTMNNRIGDPLLPWNYSDVAFLQAVYHYNWGNKTDAKTAYDFGVGRWDEKGFKDDPFNDTHLYQTYKLALYIYASRLLGPEVYNQTMLDTANDTLRAMQQPDGNGGFNSSYSYDSTSPQAIGGTNTETTSLAVLALIPTTPHKPIPEFGMVPFVMMIFLAAVVLTIAARRRKPR